MMIMMMMVIIIIMRRMRIIIIKCKGKCKVLPEPCGLMGWC